MILTGLMKMSSFVFFTLGDWGAFQQESINVLKNVAYQMNKLSIYKNPRFISTLGDNFYERGVTSIHDPKWNSSWKDIFINKYPNLQKIRWCATLGNHDYYGGYNSIEAQINKSMVDNNWFLPSENYYFLDKETNSYFIHIDTCKIYPELYYETQLMISQRQINETLNYLEIILKRANRYNANWIFVFGHYHIFSNGFYDNYEYMEKRLLPLLLKYNVDVYFCGHEHNFQVLEYKKLKLIVNGVGSYSNNVSCYNNNLSVDTHYVSSNNGFTFHDVTKNKFTINFVNTCGESEYKMEIVK